MTKLVDLTGQKYGRLTVIRRSEKRHLAGALWECSCECGGASVSNSLKLRTGHTQSCGCMKVEAVPNLRHGYSGTATHRSWKEMRQRCLNPNSDKWQWYGGRGISVCAEWDGFEVFLTDMGVRPAGKTIDRINSDGNYEKSNCRWATPTEQATTNRGVFLKNAIPVNKTSDADLLLMREMRASGMKLKDVAAHFHKSSAVVSGLINHGPRRSAEKISGVNSGH